MSEQEQDVEDDTDAQLQQEQDEAAARQLEDEQEAAAAEEARLKAEEEAAAAAPPKPLTKAELKAKEKADREALRAQTVRKPLQPPGASDTPPAPPAAKPLSVRPAAASVPTASAEAVALEAEIRKALEPYTGQISIKFDHAEKTLHIRRQGGRLECTTLKQPIENIRRVAESVAESRG